MCPSALLVAYLEQPNYAPRALMDTFSDLTEVNDESSTDPNLNGVRLPLDFIRRLDNVRIIQLKTIFKTMRQWLVDGRLLSNHDESVYARIDTLTIPADQCFSLWSFKSES